MHLAKMKRETMLPHLSKRDGTPLTLHTVDDVIAKKIANPEWRGEDSGAGGRPRELTKKEAKQLVDLVFAERGKAKVTISYCKKKLKFLRRVHDVTVARHLHAAGLKWLTRRVKRWVPEAHKEQRLSFATGVTRTHQETLDRYAYTDGTAYYLARGPAERNEKKRLALGRCVWRMANGADGLFDANVGASLYAKAQGRPVKIWGFFANGHLDYWVLPADPEKPSQKTTHMNGERYGNLIASKFAQWRRDCFGDDDPCHLVQDHEKCLWQPRNLLALRRAGCPVVANFPKSSPDLNAIEGMWGVLRQRLEATEPREFEDRAAFLARLRRCVTWLNENKSDEALKMCTNQKLRAKEQRRRNGVGFNWVGTRSAMAAVCVQVRLVCVVCL